MSEKALDKSKCIIFWYKQNALTWGFTRVLPNFA